MSTGENLAKEKLESSHRFWAKTVDIYFTFVTNVSFHSSTLHSKIDGFDLSVSFDFDILCVHTQIDTHTVPFKWYIFCCNRRRQWSHRMRCSRESTSSNGINISSISSSTNRCTVIIEVMEMNYCFVNYNPFSNLAVTIGLILFIGANFEVDLQRLVTFHIVC